VLSINLSFRNTLKCLLGIILDVKVYLLVLDHLPESFFGLTLVIMSKLREDRFNQFCEVEANVWDRVLTQSESQRDQLVVQKFVIYLANNTLDQEDGLDTLRKLFMCVEFTGFGLK